MNVVPVRAVVHGAQRQTICQGGDVWAHLGLVPVSARLTGLLLAGKCRLRVRLVGKGNLQRGQRLVLKRRRGFGVRDVVLDEKLCPFLRRRIPRSILVLALPLGANLEEVVATGAAPNTMETSNVALVRDLGPGRLERLQRQVEGVCRQHDPRERRRGHGNGNLQIVARLAAVE